MTGSSLYALGKFLGVRHLPGDIEYRRDGVTFFFPLGTGILLSIIITIVLNIVLILLRKR